MEDFAGKLLLPKALREIEWGEGGGVHKVIFWLLNRRSLENSLSQHQSSAHPDCWQKIAATLGKNWGKLGTNATIAAPERTDRSSNEKHVHEQGY